MSNVFYSNKEEIRNRIIKKAQELWGIDKVYDFDPLVVLIMEVLSSELFNISNDVNNLENRIFDKLSRILASDNLVSPLPAHGIIHFQPSEDNVTLAPYTHLTIKKKLNNISSSPTEKAVDLDFSPLQAVNLFNGRIKYLVTSKSLFEVLPNHKKILGHAKSLGKSNCIWLGITCSATDRFKAYQGLSFYFDWGNYSVDREIYNLLALSKWSLNGVPVKIYRNRFMSKSNDGHEAELFSSKRFFQVFSQDIETYYQSKFLTLDDYLDVNSIQNSTVLPVAIQEKFDIPILDRIEKNLDWVKIEFPTSITDSMLEELHVMVNAFPVFNKRQIQSKIRLKTVRNIVPIDTGDMEQLLTIDAMLDQNGVSYSEVPYSTNIHSTDVGYYTVRHGSVERFDERSAKDMIDYLFELLRDEKAAFSTYNSEFLKNILVEMDTNISLIQQKAGVKLSQIKELKNYVIINPKNEKDLVFMDVWLTYADFANGISVGSVLSLKHSSYLTSESIIFLTNTTGGRSRLNRTDSVQALKYGITTADRIVAKNDIINFIRYELGNKVHRVELRKGLVMDTSIHRGFYKTLDIHIEPNIMHGLRQDEWEELNNQTLAKLINRSTMDINYRILLDNVIYA